jgi:hypothetical protein
MRPKTLFIPETSLAICSCYSLGCEKARPKRGLGCLAEKKFLTFGGPDKTIPAGFRGANHEFSENNSAVRANNPGLTNKEIAAALPVRIAQCSACGMPPGHA